MSISNTILAKKPKIIGEFWACFQKGMLPLCSVNNMKMSYVQFDWAET